MTTDEFRKLSAFAALTVPHDWAEMAPRSSPVDSGLPDAARLLTDEEARARGFAAGVQVPIRSANGSKGVLTFLTRAADAYQEETIQKAQAVADDIAAVLSPFLKINAVLLRKMGLAPVGVDLVAKELQPAIDVPARDGRIPKPFDAAELITILS